MSIKKYARHAPSFPNPKYATGGEGGGRSPQVQAKRGEKFGQKGEKFRQKRKKKILKCGTDNAKKIVHRVPGTAAACAAFLKRGSRFGLLKSTFNRRTKMSYAGCSGLTLVISAQFSLEVKVTARNRKNESQ